MAASAPSKGYAPQNTPAFSTAISRGWFRSSEPPTPWSCTPARSPATPPTPHSTNASPPSLSKTASALAWKRSTAAPSHRSKTARGIISSPAGTCEPAREPSSPRSLAKLPACFQEPNSTPTFSRSSAGRRSARRSIFKSISTPSSVSRITSPSSRICSGPTELARLATTPPGSG